MIHSNAVRWRSAALAAVIDTNAWYRLVSRHSGKALDVWERSTADGGSGPAPGSRKMESLGRGVVAVRSSNTEVLVSWRPLGLDPAGIGFNVYRSTDGGAEVRLNGSPLTGGTNFTDSTADLSRSNSNRVRPVVDGVEQASPTWTPPVSAWSAAGQPEWPAGVLLQRPHQQGAVTGVHLELRRGHGHTARPNNTYRPR